MVVSGVGSAWTKWSMSRVPRASEPESCMTRDANVVVNRILVGVRWVIAGLRFRVMMEVTSFHHFTKGAPSKQPHSCRLDVNLSSRFRFLLPEQAMGNSAITPTRDNTTVWGGRARDRT